MSTPSSKETKEKGSSEKSSLKEGENESNSLRNFPLSPLVEHALRQQGVDFLFPIQCATFPHIYKGIDVIGRARTGTGKTLAFALPTIERLYKQEREQNGGEVLARRRVGRKPRVLVLCPTRELARQVCGCFENTSGPLGFSSCVVYGGTAYAPMQAAMRRGVDFVVGTCGRIKDLMDQVIQGSVCDFTLVCSLIFQTF